MHPGHYGPLTPGSPLAPSFPFCLCSPGASGIPGIPGMPFDPGILGKPTAKKIDFWKEEKYILIGWEKKQEHKIKLYWCRELSYNDNIENKLKIFLIFPDFDLSTVLIMISFPHTQCFQLVCDTALFTISPFSPLDPCSLFTPLIPGGPLLPRDPL